MVYKNKELQKETRKKYLSIPKNEKKHRESDKEYQAKKRKSGLVNKADEAHHR